MFIHPFDHQDIVAGQGTLGFEIIEQCPQVRTILVPVGGGGLAAGVTVAVHSLDPEVRVVGVQSAAVPGLVASMAAGHPVQVVGAPTMADGIAVQRPGDIPFSHPGLAGGPVVAVSEAALARGLLLCLERAKQVVEPAGAAGVAALLAEPGAFEPPVVVVLSGGNIDPLLLSKLLRHGLSAAGRFLGFRCRVPDYPGSLAALLGLLAELGANVLEVSHERLAPTLRVDEVEVVLQVETRGPEHCEHVKDGLARGRRTTCRSCYGRERMRSAAACLATCTRVAGHIGRLFLGRSREVLPARGARTAPRRGPPQARLS